MSPASIDHICEEMDRVRGTRDGDERYRELLAELDEFFWKECEAATFRSLPETGDELRFGPAEKLLLDAGLVDIKLVNRAGRDFLERLTAELNQVGDEGILYLTEWLSARYHSFLATRMLPGERVAESLLIREIDREDSELATARSQRNELYARLVPLFEGLPGISVELAAAIGRGTVDDRIEELLLAQNLEDRRADEEKRPADDSAGVQAKRYDSVVHGVLRQGRDLTGEDEKMRWLEAVGKLRMAIFRKSLAHASRRKTPSSEVPAESRPDPQATRHEAEAFMRRELRVLRSVLRIGSREGRVESSCSVLLNDVQRTTKRIAAEVLGLIREVDPRLGLSHDVLIAPFTGSGFFEWDRNTLIVALTPARNAEESVVNAVANFRLLSDARTQGTPIASAYRGMYGSAFRSQFLKDYRNWVLRAGRGKRDSMSDRSYRFFLDRIAPPPGGPIIPHEIVRLTVDERHEEIKRLNRLVRTGSFSADEAYRLGVLLWQREKIGEAIRQMEAALAADPANGRALYSLGVLCRKKRLTGAARKAFRETARCAPNSLWSIYAQDALRRMV